MKKNTRLYALLLTLAATLFVSHTLHSSSLFESDKVYKYIEVFSDAITIIKKNYIEEVNSKDLIFSGLKGMLSSLDPHSQFLDPEMYRSLKVDTEGQFGGLGIEISSKGKYITIISPLKGGPAHKAGIEAGDIIVKIDGTSTKDVSILEAIKMIRGPLNTEVTITVSREGANGTLEFTLTREIIKLDSVHEPQLLENNIGYLAITQFQQDTASEFIQATDKLLSQGMEALIIDLRNNPGGILGQAVGVAQTMLRPEQIIVSTRGRHENQTTEYRADKNNSWRYTFPVAVLVNKGSASGSEIVAGALQDWKRGVIIGEQTFGKASVQSIIPIKEDCAIRLTIAKYFTPGGKNIDKHGIDPDIVVAYKRPETPDDEEYEYKIEDDNQVQQAVNALQAMKIAEGFSAIKATASQNQDQQDSKAK